MKKDLELEDHHFATPDECMGLAKDHQWLMSQRGKARIPGGNTGPWCSLTAPPPAPTPKEEKNPSTWRLGKPAQLSNNSQKTGGPGTCSTRAQSATPDCGKFSRQTTQIFPQTNCKRAPGWLSWLSVWLWLRSWSHSSWVWAPRRALCWPLGAWSLLGFCVSLSGGLSLSLSKINKY